MAQSYNLRSQYYPFHLKLDTRCDPSSSQLRRFSCCDREFSERRTSGPLCGDQCEGVRTIAAHEGVQAKQNTILERRDTTVCQITRSLLYI